MPKELDHLDVAVRNLLSQVGVPLTWVGREEPPAVGTSACSAAAKSLELNFVFVRLRDPNGAVAAHFAQGNECVALGDWLQERLAGGEHLWRTQVVPCTSDDTQGAAESRCEVLPESRHSGRGARSADDRSAQSTCLLSETLTAREREILVMISRGASNKQIARDLKISPETVKSHMKRIFMKLGASSRAEAVCRAGSMGVL